MSVQAPVRDPNPPAERDPAPGRDLLTNRLVAAVLRSRLYPGVLQAVVAAGFVLVGYQLLLGPDAAHDNFGTALMWVLWWPLIPIVFVFLGRFWCAVCPFGLLNDLVQKLVGAERPVPKFLKNYGIWIIDASFLLITWADHVWGVVESPWGSGMLVLLLTTAVVISGAFFQRRTFCRYLCFLGGLSGNYARTGMLALRANTDVCKSCKSRAACFNGTDKVPGCPLFEFPRTMDSNANCNLCARCIKNCPNDAITLTVRPPTQELWFIRNPKAEQSLLAMAIMGIVVVQNVTMLQWWNGVLAWIERTTGVSNYAIIFTAAFAIAVSAPVALLALASRIAGKGNEESVVSNFARFGYALIPLDMAGHIAHNLFHLLAEGGSVIATGLTFLGLTGHTQGAQLVATGTIQLLQYALVALGVAASGYTAYRIAKSRFGTGTLEFRTTLAPYAVLILTFGALNIGLFTMPMAHRM